MNILDVEILSTFQTIELFLQMAKLNPDFDECDAEFVLRAIREKIKNNELSGKAQGRMLEILKIKNIKEFTLSYNKLSKTLLDTAVSRYLCSEQPAKARMNVILDKLNKSGVPMTTKWDKDSLVKATKDNKRGVVYLRAEDLDDPNLLAKDNPLKFFVYALRPIVFHRSIDMLNFHGVFPITPQKYEQGVHQCWELVIDDTSEEQQDCIRLGQIEFSARVKEFGAL
jgi:hypothetical protein